MDAVIYLVDTADRERFPEAKKELDVRRPRAAAGCAAICGSRPVLCSAAAAHLRHPAPPLPCAAQGLLSTEQLANTPFLILGNKIDMPYAVSEDELRACLGLRETTGHDVTTLPKDLRPIEVFMCSILRKTGDSDGLKWLTNFL